jgi:hypothetical protein
MIMRQYRDGRFLREQILQDCKGCCVRASNPILMMGLYGELLSLSLCGHFRSTHDCAGCFVFVLGERAVARSLPFDWGWSATMLVVLDFALMRAQDCLLTRDYDSSPESNLGNILKLREFDGTRTKNRWNFALLIKSNLRPMPEQEPGHTPATTSPKMTKMSWEQLDVTWRTRTSRGI